MCGIAGLIKNKQDDNPSSAMTRMLETMAHRGPDGEGIYHFQQQGVVLGHRRLAIIDPENGKQPMHSEDGQLTVVFNGAIYNYLELRRELIAKGHPLRSYSDTEVILYAYREWGEHCLERFTGMFAFAILDKANDRIFCARDRVGIKPFYYACDGKTLIFASEIKAILAEGSFPAERNAEALQDYLTFQFCLGEKTLFKNIHKLEPGHFMIVPLGAKPIAPVVRSYWDVSYEVNEEKSESWFIDHLAGLIEDAVRMNLRSDVPLGAHLSGGLDSTTVVCLAANLLNGEKLKTFTGAFPEGPQFDETPYAKLVSAAAKTEYHDVYIHGSDLAAILPRLMFAMDEPLAGPGLIPQYYVSKLASQNVKVVVGGQGGDELFIGYARYLVAYLESCLSGAINETASKNRYAVSLESIIPNLPVLQNYHTMLQGFWRDGLFNSADKRYFKLIDRSEGLASVLTPDAMPSGYSPFSAFQNIFNDANLHSLINRMTHFDLKASLPALLHIEDRMSMAASIESRVPLLDHRIVEFMAQVPPNIKFAGGDLKHLFKGAVKNMVPPAILARKDKMGFPTPFSQWCKGVSGEFVRDILFSPSARQRGLYNCAALEHAIDHEPTFGRGMWGLLCLELWHRIFIDKDMTPGAP